MMKNSFSIKIKIFIPVILLFILFLVIIYIFLIRLTEKNCRRIMRQQHSTLAQTIERSINYAMSAGKKDEILPILNNIKRGSMVLSVSITNEQGEVLKTTNKDITFIIIPPALRSGMILSQHKDYYRSF